MMVVEYLQGLTSDELAGRLDDDALWRAARVVFVDLRPTTTWGRCTGT